MTYQEQKHKSIYQYLVYSIDSEEHRNKIINDCSEDKILLDYDNKKYIEFSEKISQQWILELLRHLNNKDINKIQEKKNYILNLQEYFTSQLSITSNSEIDFRYESEIDFRKILVKLSMDEEKMNKISENIKKKNSKL